MEAYGPPLEALAAGLIDFIKSPQVRLLVVETTPELRAAALELTMAHEYRPENRQPFYAFEHAFTAQNPGWNERSQFATKQAAHRAGADGAAPLGVSSHGQPGFAATFAALARDPPAGAEGAVAVLAPATIGDPPRWVAALEPMISDPGLAAVRFVVLETQPAPSAALATRLSASARIVRAQPDPTTQARDAEDLLAGASSADKHIGAAPQATAPAHPARAPKHAPTAESELRGLVNTALLGAATQMQAGNFVEAVSSVRKARDLVRGAGLEREAINIDLLLGSTLLQAGGLPQAQAAFTEATQKASAAGKHDLAATAHFSLGASKLSGGDQHGALVTYAEGTVCAERSSQPALAIEGGRLTGGLAANLGMETQAIAFWTKAVKLAEASGPSAPLSSGGESARNLAELCRKRGLADQAADYEARADNLENLVPQPAPTPPTPEVHSAPVGAPVLFNPPAANEVEEGTDMLSVGDIARLHRGVQDAQHPQESFGGPAETPSELSNEQLEILRQATVDVLDDESTDMLTADELAVLHGDAAMQMPAPRIRVQPAPAPASKPELDLGFDLDKIAALREVEIDDEHDGGTTVRKRSDLADPTE